MVKCHKCGKEFNGEITGHDAKIPADRLCSECSVTNNNISSDIDWSKLPKIIAVDFDGVLSKGIFPKIGLLNYRLIADLLEWRKAIKGKLILWTCRTGKDLDNAVNALKPHIVFDAINTNVDEVKKVCGGDTRKVYANLYIDDKAKNYRFEDHSFIDIMEE